MARHRTSREKHPDDRGNAVSEWFGHRVYPTVAASTRALTDQRQARCPFLSVALREDKGCIKADTSSGICTISSVSNGPRQDWLVCPYRALDQALMEDAARRIFGVRDRASLWLVPAPTLARQEVRQELVAALAARKTVLVYFQDKLGGEISIPATDRSPELAFDITLVQVARSDSGFEIARYGILEIQTMDFHGSYRYAVSNLRDALRLHGDRFPSVLQQNQAWLADRVEGPNIANVFKRTFYQIMLKFRIGTHEPCAGCVLAIPQSVWDSWQRHLGKPVLQRNPDNTFTLRSSRKQRGNGRGGTWIYIFDLEASGATTPNPISIAKVVQTDADALSYCALTVAPEAAVAAGGSAGAILPAIRRRLAAWWPELAGPDDEA